MAIMNRFPGGGGSGDFKADGSVPMTGNLSLNNNSLLAGNNGSVVTDRISSYMGIIQLGLYDAPVGTRASVGNVILRYVQDPEQASDAANKNYVDTLFATATGDFKADGSVPMTGDLNMDNHFIRNIPVLASGSSITLNIAGRNKVLLNNDSMVFNTPLEMNGKLISNVGAPLNASDAVNKVYVDEITKGTAWNEAVKGPPGTGNITVVVTRALGTFSLAYTAEAGAPAGTSLYVKDTAVGEGLVFMGTAIGSDGSNAYIIASITNNKFTVQAATELKTGITYYCSAFGLRNS